MKLHYNLLRPSTYAIGLAYELLVIDVLEKYSFQLKHIGGAGDKGQDFIGYWTLPNKKIAVVGQCKCYMKPVGPSDVREFEGVLLRKFNASSQCIWSTQLPLKSSQFIGIMASQSWFSVSALRTFQSSKVPMMLSQILAASDQSHSPDPDTNDCSRLIQSANDSDHSCDNESGNGGYVNELALNSSAQKLLGNILVSWKHNSNSRRELTLIVPV